MNEQVIFLSGKHVGVTGANGFIGSHICEILAQKGALIRAFIYPGTPTRVIDQPISKSGGEVVDLDITRPETIAGKFDTLDYLFQVAGTVAEWARPVRKIFDINFRGVQNVHRAARKAGVRRVIHTSTMSANGSCSAPFPALTDESAPWNLQRTGAYSVSKHLGDQVAKNANQIGIYETIRIRPHQVLGWGDTGPSEPGKLILQAMKGGFPAYIDQVTQPVHVEDVAWAHVAAMERGTPGSVYNIASAHPVPVFYLLWFVAQEAGARPPAPIAIPKGILRVAALFSEVLADHVTHKPPLLTRGNARMLDLNMGTSIARARRELGFNPRPWQDAVKDAIRWFKQGYQKVPRTYDK